MNKRIDSADKAFIENNASIRTDKQISEHIGCSIKTVERYRKNIGLIKNASRNPLVITMNSKAYNDRSLLDFYRTTLENTPKGRRFKQQLAPEEWEVFVEEWCAYHLQLEDLTHTEQTTVEQIIFLKLRIDKNQKEYYESSRMKDILISENNIVDIKDLDLTDPKQAELYQKLYNASLRTSDLNKEYKDFLDKSTRLSETLNVTRRQREEKGKVGGDTFFSLCKQFESIKTKEKEGKLAALYRLALETNQKKLRNGLEFIDGEIAPQLLDSETVLKSKETE